MITIGIEDVSIDVLDKIAPLAKAHCLEFLGLPNFEMPTDYYMKLAQQDMLEIFTAHDGDDLVGYLAVVLYKDHKSLYELYAMEEALYVTPSHRSAGIAGDLVAYAEDYCKEIHGAVCMVIPLPHKSSLLTDVGYSIAEYTYKKELR